MATTATAACGIRVAAANTQIFNNTIVNNSDALVIYDYARSPGAACLAAPPTTWA